MEITTPRLLLRDFQPEDIQAYLEFDADGEVRQHMLAGQQGEDYSHRFVQGCITCAAQTPRFFFGLAITRQGDDTLIGFCTLALARRTPGIARIGWGLDRRFWGQGYVTEAARSVSAFAFHDLGVSWLRADCFADNRASIRVMEKIGMTPVRRGWFGQWAARARYGESRAIVSYQLGRHRVQ